MSVKKITIKDIAKKLNIHHSTVSRALRNDSSVKAETRELIKETAREMNYKPNFFAQSLKNRFSKFIGVIVPEIKHDFFAKAISGIEDYAYERGYIIIICQSNEDPEREVMTTNALASYEIGGLLVSVSQNTRDGTHLREILSQGIKLVMFDRVIDDIECSKVIVDDYKGAFDATKHLIKMGRRRIAHIGGTKDLNISQERFHGYKDALKEAKIKYDPELVFFGGFQEENGIEGMQYLLGAVNPPDAVFCVNDPTAIGAYEVLKKRNYKIPDDVAVIGYSNSPMSNIISPSLTTVDQPAYELGREAAKLLIQEMEKGKSKATLKKLRVKLIKRDSA